jgi:hypothetical protein
MYIILGEKRGYGDLLRNTENGPFQGFLKRTRIGNDTTYNLEFKLPCISERLELSIEMCNHDFNKDMPATPLTRLKVPYSKSLQLRGLEKGRMGTRR